jgi:vacuolar-type H+-ATPase subunit F/Vma7
MDVATAAAIGEALTIEGYALAGAVVFPADSQDEATAAFDALPANTALLVLTAGAAGWLAGRLGQRPDILTAVMAP